MAVFSLNTNLASLQTRRRLSESTSALAKAFERLSSGLRISRTSDDAAGLAIALGLQVDSRVFTQGIRNLSDGISVTNIAEGGVNELTNIVIRLQELSEQASNGTLGSAQRKALDGEAQALSKEYFRIAQTAEFNGKKLFDGSVQGLALQGGYSVLSSSLGGKRGAETFDSTITYGTGTKPESVALGDFNQDGALDIVTANYGISAASVLFGNGDGTFKAKSNHATASGSVAVIASDLNEDGLLDIVTANALNDSISILLGNGDGEFKARADFSTGWSPYCVAAEDINADGVLDIVSANRGTDNVSILLGNGDGSFRDKVDYAAGPGAAGVALGDLNADGIPDIVSANIDENSLAVLLGNRDGSFQAKATLSSGSGYFATIGDLNGDAVLDIVTTNWYEDSVSVLIGNGDGTFRPKIDFGTGVNPRQLALGDLNGDGCLDMVVGTFGAGAASVLFANGDGNFKAAVQLTAPPTNWIGLGDLNGDGVYDIVSANYTSDQVSVSLSKTREGVAPLLDFSLRSRADAKWALELMKRKLIHLAEQRGVIGANQSRLSTAVATLAAERENYLSASSQITDVDVALESAQLVKNQILQKAGSAVLAQANQGPELALLLLNGDK